MSIVNVPTEKLIELCKEYFKKENDRVVTEFVVSRDALTTERRFFGLLKPKYTKEDVSKWTTPTIYDCMSFQVMYPHHKIAELLLSADLAKTSGIEGLLVKTKIFNLLG